MGDAPSATTLNATLLSYQRAAVLIAKGATAQQVQDAVAQDCAAEKAKLEKELENRVLMLGESREARLERLERKLARLQLLDEAATREVAIQERGGGELARLRSSCLKLMSGTLSAQEFAEAM